MIDEEEPEYGGFIETDNKDAFEFDYIGTTANSSTKLENTSQSRAATDAAASKCKSKQQRIFIAFSLLISFILYKWKEFIDSRATKLADKKINKKFYESIENVPLNKSLYNSENSKSSTKTDSNKSSE